VQDHPAVTSSFDHDLHWLTFPHCPQAGD